MFKNYKKFIIAVFAGALVLAAAFPDSAWALTARKGDNVVVSEDINSNFFTAGNLVIIEGTVNGDVFAAGNTVEIRGTVNGDVFAAGNNVDISGTVNGSLRLAGSNINVRGKVAHNILAVGNNLSVDEGAAVGGHVTYAGASMVLQGPIGGQIDAASPSIVINNSVSGDVNLMLGGPKSQLSLLDKAALAGKLTYQAQSEATVSASAKVLGGVQYKPWEKSQTHQTNKAAARAAFAGVAALIGVVGFIGMFLTGLLLIYLAPKLTDKIYGTAKELPWANLGIGVVGLIVTPIAAGLLIITIVGAPLGLLTMVGFAAGMYLSKAMAGIMIGRWILERFKWRWHKVWSLLLGLIVFALVCLIPFVGWLAAFLLILLAFGALLRVDGQLLKEWR